MPDSPLLTAPSTVPFAVLGCLGILALLLLWYPLSALFAWWSGWSELARVHRQRSAHPFERLTTIGVSRGRGVVRYPACANVSATERGLRVALVLPLFRHPPLSIPWEALRFESLEDKRATLAVEGTRVTLFFRSVHLIAQLRYWVDDADDDPPLPVFPRSPE
jgi:hypothetical protein